jgi:hypothetical protein
MARIADDPHFTGKSVVRDKDLSVARRSCEARARSAWHSHDNGQLPRMVITANPWVARPV